MSFRYTDEKIPKRPAQGGKSGRSVFDAAGGERGRSSRWKIISPEELFTGTGSKLQWEEESCAGRKMPDEDGTFTRQADQERRITQTEEEPDPFTGLIRMMKRYQVTEEGRRRAFLEQARWMESYEEEGRIPDTEFYHQYVGYQEMDVWELHAYFSWRTGFRRGESVPYCYEFMRLHAAELINLIGAADKKEAFDRLLKLQAETVRGSGLRRGTVVPGRSFERLSADRKKMDGILSGFLIVRAADLKPCSMEEMLQAYCIPDPEREAENVTLLHYEESDDTAIYRMISSLTPDRIRHSRFLSQAGEDAWRVIARVFRNVCRKQKEAESPVLAERLLGTRRVLYRDLFPMTPYETHAEEGCIVEVSPVTSYLHKGGHWYRSDYPLIRDDRALRELHELVRECERVLRKKYHYRNALPNRMKNPVLEKMISEEADRWRKEKALRNRPEVRVDLSRLGAIRDLAAITQERLLEGTEEGIQADEQNVLMNDPADAGSGADFGGETAAGDTAEGEISADETAAVQDTGRMPDPAAETGSDVGEGLFSPHETAFLKLLLDGGNGADFFRGHKVLPSVFVDAINEKAFDEIGDSIVEEGSGGWQLVEDYVRDVRDLL